MTAPAVTLSAIVISYNGMRFLPDCLRTLVADLEGIDHELIVVDNGSTDGSVDFIRDNFPKARLVENRVNLGFAKAVNIGIEQSRGEYCYIVNQDLRFRKGATKALLEKIKSDKSLGMIGPAFVNFDGRLQKSARALPTCRHVIYRALFLDRLFSSHREFGGWRMGWFDHRQERLVEQPMGAVMMIPAKVIAEVGLMDESFPIFFNDVDYCKRLKLAGYDLLYYPEAVVEHYIGGSTSRRPYRTKITSHSSMFRYLRKYARWYEYPVLGLCGLLLLIGLVPVLAETFLRTRFSAGESSS